MEKLFTRKEAAKRLYGGISRRPASGGSRCSASADYNLLHFRNCRPIWAAVFCFKTRITSLHQINEGRLLLQ